MTKSKSDVAVQTQACKVCGISGIVEVDISRHIVRIHMVIRRSSSVTDQSLQKHSLKALLTKQVSTKPAGILSLSSLEIYLVIKKQYWYKAGMKPTPPSNTHA